MQGGEKANPHLARRSGRCPAIGSYTMVASEWVRLPPPSYSVNAALGTSKFSQSLLYCSGTASAAAAGAATGPTASKRAAALENKGEKP